MDQKDEREIKALISLTDEPDERIFEEIADKIFSFGANAVPFLEERWENSFDPSMQQRILNIIHKIQYDIITNELGNWVKFGSHNLYIGYLLITRFQYPEIKEEEIKSKLEEIKRDIWLELNEGLTALEKIKVINHIFYDVHGFIGNTTNFHAPQNFYLNTLLETHKGNPLSLGLLYIIIAQQLQLPVFGVNLPEHFVLAYTNDLSAEKLSFLDDGEVLFYINPFSKGAVFSKKEIELFIKQLKIGSQDIFFRPCTNQDIIIRLINNLIYAYDKLGHTQKIEELKMLMKIVSKQ
ncbi:MAG: transglutaminase-like domain-containing protein [Bacteroidales bacterium]|jgi:regulator of sirC expression with transglutaminase-like and TPR domain